mgnify:CR=1 FL=1
MISEEKRREMVERSVTAITDIYQNSILKDSSRNSFMIKRMEDLADRTIWAMGEQLKCGDFVPFVFEHKFNMEVGDGDRKQLMSGTIDRVDICENGTDVYVRIIDYKTGKKDFNIVKTYYGIDIQLMVYMEAAMKLVAKMRPGKNAIPAGVFYYNISDPMQPNSPSQLPTISVPAYIRPLSPMPLLYARHPSRPFMCKRATPPASFANARAC